MERKVESRIRTSTGVRATLPADVRILDSTFLSNQYGVYGSGGAIVNVSRSAFSGSQYAVYASGDVNATYTKVTISDTIAAGNIYGFTAESLTGTTGNVSMAVTRSTASNGNYGIYVHRVGGNNVWAALSGNLVTHNSVSGIYNGGGSAVYTQGNNTVKFNTLDLDGVALTAMPGV